MTQETQHINSASPFCILVTFSWGSSSVARYCRWTEDITIGSDTFTSVPSLSAKLRKPMEGGTSPAECKISLPESLRPADTASLPYKHPEISVLVEEFSPGDNTSREVLFFGQAERLQSGSGMVRFVCKDDRAKLARAKVGIPALSTCIHTFGEGDCLFDKAAAKVVFVPTAFFHGSSPNKIQGTIQGSPNMENSRWARGYLEFDKMQIGIRAVTSQGVNPNPTVTLELKDIPPPSWQLQQVDMFPGCPKTLTGCKDSFRNQESQYLALGTSMLDYNPGFSDDPNA